jgi:2-keto-3-deoxy-L-rhamnonate aldolase RhmA
MFERLRRDELAVGTIFLTHGPEWIELAGHMGFDLAIIDMMFTSIDWDSAAHMIRAASRYEMTPWVRLQSYPWSAGGVDGRALADTARAFALGAEVVTISLDEPAHIAALLEVKDWHRHVHIYDSPKGIDEREVLLVPQLESLGAIERADEIMALPGLRAVWLGLGDLSRALGHPGEPDHPDVRRVIERIVRLGVQHGVRVVSNAGRRYDHSTADTLASTRWLHDLGVRVAIVPYFTLIVQRYYDETMRALRAEFPVSDG